MNKNITFFVILFLTFIGLANIATIKVKASNVPNSLQTNSAQEVVSKKLDKEALILQKYLAQFDSPMQDQAQDFIDAAKTYDLDWKMLPAIAGVESTFGKQIPGGFNAYGWGVYGDQALYFKSWTDGIFTVAKGLREGYLNKGYTDPYTINRIYAASPSWGSRVTYFMQDLEKFAKNFNSSLISNNKIENTPSIAAVSGQLVSEKSSD